MKKPYIKKYKRVYNNILVYIVDGKYIRDNIDEEFTNCAMHEQFKFIPKNEFWIDKEGKAGEKKFYIDSMIFMRRLLERGVSYKEAWRISDNFDRAERTKPKRMEEKIRLKKNPEKILNLIHKQLLKEYSKHIKIWIVDGEAVRGLFFNNFTQGGHGYVYNFIPKDEIWIDDDIGRNEIPLVLLHELHERRLMQKKKLDYDTAHIRSSKIEYYCRQHPKMLDKKLKKEIDKNR